MSDISCGTVYDLVQAQMDIYKCEPKDIEKDLVNIGAWFSIDMHEQYYMFLNKELSDYTIFNFLTMNYNKGLSELRELIESRGSIIKINYNHDNKYFEVWVRHCSDNYPHMYILFPCSDFIIEV